jgi:cobalt-zinc-cadmium resistance protein CzcA
VPGANFGFSQPIEMRVDELVAGVKADVAVLIYGDDLDTLGTIGKQIENVLQGIRGSADVRADWQANVPTLRIDSRQDQLARHGIDGIDVMQTVSAMGGIQTGVIYEGRPRYPLMVKFPQAWRENEDLVPQIPVATAGGRPVPLGELADIRIEESPPSIEHENSRRRTFVSANVRGRDVASFVAEAQRRIAAEVKLPSGYAIEWGGDFENLLSASRRLLLITPVVLGLIALLLYTSFKSLRLAALIFCAVPVAASGGIAALALREMPFSIAAGVGCVPPDRLRQGVVADMSIADHAVLNVRLLRSGGALLHPAAQQRAAQAMVDAYAIKAGDLAAPVRGLSGGNMLGFGHSGAVCFASADVPYLARASSA